MIPQDKAVAVYELVKNIIAPGNRAFMSPSIQSTIDFILDHDFPDGWRENQDFILSLRDSFFHSNFNYESDFHPHYYAAYYLPNNLYKIQLMFLDLIVNSHLDLSRKQIKVLDIGSCIGTTAWALMDFYEILSNVCKLYGIKFNFPALQINSIEISENNIDFFLRIREHLSYNNKLIQVPDPIKCDVMDSHFQSKVLIEEYDIIFASNVICELGSVQKQVDFSNQIIDKLKNSSFFIVIETARRRDSKLLNTIRYNASLKRDIQILSPCAKLGKCREQCKSCWIFRRESLIAPNTMKVLSMDEELSSDENEKLKWSYLTVTKSSKQLLFKKEHESLTLDQTLENLTQSLDIYVEILSSRIEDSSYEEDYFLKICDQSEKSSLFMLKVPKYFEIPRYNFGDILFINNANIQKINLKTFTEIKYAISIDPSMTEITNVTNPSHRCGLISFKNVKEENVRYFAKRFFNFDNFLDGQFEIIKKVLENESVLGILSTGGGKSLTFQLSSLLKPGISIVISPLKSLMDDQVHVLKRRFGLDFVDRIHSGMSQQEKDNVLQRLQKGLLKILYVAPERMKQLPFQKELKALIDKGICVNYFSIDEAHCISEWGHDFRPPYSRLKKRQQALSDQNGKTPPIIALTATASELVRKDVLKLLHLDREKHLIHQIVDRKELSLEVISLRYDRNTQSYSIRYRGKKENGIPSAFIEKHFDSDFGRHDILLYTINNILPLRLKSFDINQHSGLIFTVYANPTNPERAKQGAEWISRHLKENNIECKPWYADLPEDVKADTQEEFISDKIKMLACTKGFGMGIDKPNIRFTIHYGFPGSLEEFFQQVGRAGRDRNHSHCILLWDSPEDSCSQLIRSGHNPIPECYEYDHASKVIKFTSCTHGRSFQCDYAKRIFFIENGYPTKEEIQASIEFINHICEKQGSKEWIYFRSNDLMGHVVRKLRLPGYRVNFIKEELFLNTLRTLNVIEDYEEPFFKVRFKGNRTFHDIRESTNNSFIKESISFLENTYGTDFIHKLPSNYYCDFDILEYVELLSQRIRREFLVEETIYFFNLLRANLLEGENIYFPSSSKGYEVKLNQKEVDWNNYERILEWKEAQYMMLHNLVVYADLQPFDSDYDHRMCRRAQIFSIFSTEGARLDDLVRCNYCDNCGFLNFWDRQANNIAASLEENRFRNELSELYSSVATKDMTISNALPRLFNLLKMMKEMKYYAQAKNATDHWQEQREQAKNPIVNLMSAVLSYKDSDFDAFAVSLKLFYEAIKEDYPSLREVFMKLSSIYQVSCEDIYRYLFTSSKESILEAMNIFDSKITPDFEDIEAEAFLDYSEYVTDEFQSITDKYGDL